MVIYTIQATIENGIAWPSEPIDLTNWLEPIDLTWVNQLKNYLARLITSSTSEKN